ncbi:TonB-dependent receptor [Parvularcula maris]|uniref:TonB-dependent receptor n=1 Tax=Parvularcula maris TaxID=2965077 RepID=A0A9X2LB91_9PROT|nr:TonB-dependent receptor [Parvularcula maris]MCQ8186294.1 TonB-dependent receptor [Parvularcula maris]
MGFLLLTTSLFGSISAPAATAAVSSALHDPDEDVIIVTASPLDRPSDQLIAPVSILEGEELQRQLRGTLGETLRREPGVTSTSFGPGASRPIIRGLGGDRVRTLTNGIGSIDAAAASPDHATPIEPALAERIEIVRGTGLLRYGSSAAGGVVNVLDGRIASETPEDGLEAAVRVAGTTVDNGIETSASLQGKLFELGGLDVVYSGQVAYRDAEDIDIPGFAESDILRALEEEEEHEHDEEHEDEEERGTLENSFQETLSFANGLSFIGERGFFGFSVQRNETQYGVPGGHGHGHGHEEEEGEEHEGEEHEEEEGGVFIELDQTRVDVNGRLEMDGPFQRFDIFAGYADYEHIEFEGPGEPGTVFSNEGFEIRAEAAQQQRGNWRGATGVQYRGREFSAIGEEAFVPPTETDQFGVYTFQELSFGEGVIEASARYEHTEQLNTVTGVDLDFDGISAAIGGSYPLAEGVTATLNLFRTERAPTTEELFSDGPHLATSSFDIGDASLDKETALGIEAGIRFANDRASLSINGFYTDYEDFIFQQADGTTGADILLARGEDDEEELEEFGELMVLNFVAEDARFAGVEVVGRADLFEANGFDVSTDVVVDYVDAESDSDNLPRIPPLGVIWGIDAVTGPLALRAEAEYASEQDDTAEFELPTDSFTVANFYADYQITDRVTLSGALLNAFDEEARIHASFLKDVAPQPGRNFRIALRLTY